MIIPKFFLTVFFCSVITTSPGQINVKFTVKQRPAAHTPDSIFIAGSFNSWNPADNRYHFKPEHLISPSLIIQLTPGIYEYKFTRGGWNKVETGSDGKDLANRTLTVTTDTIIDIVINGWKDDFTSVPVVRKHTASQQVQILDTAFYMGPQLNRKRRIWVYLPADYAVTSKRFPVLYMHDGQNLFDEATSGFGEWGVDEYLDSLSGKGKKSCIVIGIDNGSNRMNEYNPYHFNPYGSGEGDQYVDFLVKTLKPYIDQQFRTLPGKKNTFIAGSSMGGLISLYAVMRYPGVFGGAGIFSPAFWTASGLENDIAKTAGNIKSKLFFYAGGKESSRMIPDMQNIKLQITRSSSSKVYEKLDIEGKHNETAWRQYFPEFYKWILN